jgi:hypothetical protein
MTVAPRLAKRRTDIDRPQQRQPAVAAERAQQLPCWLTSLVLHLCLVIVLNSYVIYAGGYSTGGIDATGSIHAISCVTTGRLEPDLEEGSEDTASEEPTTLDSAAAETESDALTTFDLGAAAPFATDVPIAAEVPITPGAPVVAEIPQRGVWSEPVETVADVPRDNPPTEMGQAAQPPRQQLAAGPQKGDPSTTTRAVPPIDQIPSPAADPTARPASEEVKDAIVNQFIEYDLGHLHGEEAARALREFQSLRPDSIPAVVRGLNRSARIAGTCPVMVLSRKLEDMLSETSDPAMIRYAFENLGRDLPKNAAHYQRIATLRQRLLSRQKQQVAEALVQQGIAADDILLARMAPLFNAGADRLNKALGDPNSVIRQVAAMQIDDRLAEFSELEKRRLARSLVRLLNDARPEPAAAAHAALRKLADGDDYGPAPGATPAEIAEAMREWNRAFNSAGDVPDERVAKSLLALARSLEHRGRKEAATQRYRDICERYPESAAAKQAEKQLELLEADPQ